MKPIAKTSLCFVSAAVLVSGCANMDDKTKSAGIGAALERILGEAKSLAPLCCAPSVASDSAPRSRAAKAPPRKASAGRG